MGRVMKSVKLNALCNIACHLEFIYVIAQKFTGPEFQFFAKT